MTKAIPEKWLCDTVAVETGFAFDTDRNRIVTTEDVSNVCVTNIRRAIGDGNGGKVLSDSLILVTDSRTVLNDGSVFIPKVNAGIIWHGVNYKIKSVVPFSIRGSLHHYEATLI